MGDFSETTCEEALLLNELSFTDGFLTVSEWSKEKMLEVIYYAAKKDLWKTSVIIHRFYFFFMLEMDMKICKGLKERENEGLEIKNFPSSSFYELRIDSFMKKSPCYVILCIKILPPDLVRILREFLPAHKY